MSIDSLKGETVTAQRIGVVPLVRLYLLEQLCVQANFRSGQRFRHGTVLFGVQRIFLKCRVVNARNVGLDLQLDSCDGKPFAKLVQFLFDLLLLFWWFQS